MITACAFLIVAAASMGSHPYPPLSRALPRAPSGFDATAALSPDAVQVPTGPASPAPPPTGPASPAPLTPSQTFADDPEWRHRLDQSRRLLIAAGPDGAGDFAAMVSKVAAWPWGEFAAPRRPPDSDRDATARNPDDGRANTAAPPAAATATTTVNPAPTPTHSPRPRSPRRRLLVPPSVVAALSSVVLGDARRRAEDTSFVRLLEPLLARATHHVYDAVRTTSQHRGRFLKIAGNAAAGGQAAAERAGFAAGSSGWTLEIARALIRDPGETVRACILECCTL